MTHIGLKAGRIVTRMAVASALATGMVFVPSLATRALAAGTVSITKNEGNGNVTYDAYLIFTGTVDATNTRQMSGLAWKDAATRTAVVGAISAFETAAGRTYTDPSDAAASAQQAAEFISSNIRVGSETTPSTDSTYVVPAGSFAKALSDGVRSLSTTTGSDPITPGTPKSLATDGYYLFLSTPSSVTGKSTGTSPIFAVIGGGNTTEITEKTSVPTIEKHLKVEDPSAALGGWGKATDKETGATVEYRILTTLPANLASYSTYHHRISDTLPTGLAPITNSISVKAYASLADATGDTNGTVLSTGVTSGFNGQVLTVDIENVKGLTLTGGAQLTPSSVIAVYYNATVGADMTHGQPGNANGASLTYSHDPNAGGEGTTTTDGTKVYNYVLNIHKQDKTNSSQNLQGAKFTLRLTTDDHTAANSGKYVQANGSLGIDPYEFVTGTDGNISIQGIDSGTYLLHETAAPPASGGVSYDIVADTTITINANPDTSAMQVAPSAQSEVFTLAASKTGSADVVIADSVNEAGTATGTTPHADTGIVPVVVMDTKKALMPLTGQAGVAAFVVLGVAAAIVAAKLLIPSGKGGDRK